MSVSAANDCTCTDTCADSCAGQFTAGAGLEQGTEDWRGRQRPLPGKWRMANTAGSQETVWNYRLFQYCNHAPLETVTELKPCHELWQPCNTPSMAT
jgi:hypothetical protein